MISELKEILQEKGLLVGVKGVIIGYSGGPDSTLLKELFKSTDRSVVLAYFNHNLRSDSDEEEFFVKKEAERIGLPLRIGEEDVRKYCEKHSLSIEEGARNLRLSFLHRIKNDEGADIIALGHNLDDQIENFFIRLMRGAGFGLASMGYQDGDIIRPLLSIRKKEIIEYLDGQEIPYYRDPSNEDSVYLRNRIRSKLIPVIEEIQDGSMSGIERSIENIKDMEEALRRGIGNITIIPFRNHVEVEREIFAKLQASERFLVLHKMLSLIDNEKTLKRCHISDFPEKGVVELDGAYIEVTRDKILVVGKVDIQGMELPLNGEASFGDFDIRSDIVDSSVDFLNNECEYFDLKDLKLPLKVRGRRNGEEMSYFSSGNKKKLKDIFINEKIPRTLRDSWPIIYDSEGILLIPGVQRSNRAIVTKKTEKVLLIRYKRVNYGG